MVLHPRKLQSSYSRPRELQNPHRLFQNKVLRKKYRPKRQPLLGEQTQLYQELVSFTLQSVKSILFESNKLSVYTTSLCVEEFSIIKTKQNRRSLSTDVSRNRHLMEEREHSSSANEGLSNHKATGW